MLSYFSLYHFCSKDYCLSAHRLKTIFARAVPASLNSAFIICHVASQFILFAGRVRVRLEDLRS